MSILKYRGLLVVVLWQAVPAPVQVDSTGRVQLFLGLGAGQFEEVQTTCEGDVIHSQKHAFRGAGGRLDAWPTRTVRVTAFGGGVGSDTRLWRGAYFGGLAALELQHLGLGGGVAATPRDGERWPVGYLRLGNRDVAHLRVEVSPPNPPLDGAGAVRAGIGFGQGHLRRIGGEAGIAFCQAACADDTNKGSLYGELRVPVGSAVDVELRGLLGSGETELNTGVGVGARIHLARPPRPVGVSERE